MRIGDTIEKEQKESRKETLRRMAAAGATPPPEKFKWSKKKK